MGYYGCASAANKKRWQRSFCFVFIALILLAVGALTVSYGGKENSITGGVLLGLCGIALCIAAVPLVLMAVRAQPPEPTLPAQKADGSTDTSTKAAEDALV